MRQVSPTQATESLRIGADISGYGNAMSDSMNGASPAPALSVVDVVAVNRFELLLDGERIGFADYFVDASGYYVFPHVEIEPKHGGRGLGGVLVRGALDAMRQRNAKIVPRCPFVVAWVDAHPRYADLVAAN